MRSRIAGGIALALAAALIAASAHRAIGAGPVTAGHATIENDCLACHAPFRGPAVARCAGCHPADSIPGPRARLATGSDRRVSLAALHRAPAARDCLACHTDHAGRERSRATVAFAHDRLDATIGSSCATCHEGARPADALHRRTDRCAACHGTDAWTPARFAHDSLDRELAARCGACHARDVPQADGLHGPATSDCAACHGTSRWSPARFEHRAFFVLDADHDVRCATCHTTRGDYRRYTCYGCHEHTVSGMQRVHAEEGLGRRLDDCARCHRQAEGEGGESHGARDD